VWLCVPGGDQEGIMAALGLTPIRPATFSLATTVNLDDLDDPAGLVFVTPELYGWTVVVGRWCDPCHPSRAEPVRQLAERLSSLYGEVHAYFITEYFTDSAWLVARDGQTIRRYIEGSPELSLGAPLPIERRALDALGVTGTPEELCDNEELEDTYIEFGGECTAMAVARELSVDIVGGVWRTPSDVHGTGMLAGIPGAPPTPMPPGHYAI
jgi:hypothetical protein